MPSEKTPFDEFVSTVARLRAPDGCPWDKEQTHQTIASNMIEEAYEAVDAIENDDIEHMREELGDVLLQVVLQSQIAKDNGEFSIDDVCRDVNEKMIRRHPHVFGDVEATDANEVLDIWDKKKLEEKPVDTTAILNDVPKSFPALMQAQKLSRKAASIGLDSSLEELWNDVQVNMDELKSAYDLAPKSPNGKISKDDPSFKEDAEQALGELLFTYTEIARKMGLDAEGSLRHACSIFRKDAQDNRDRDDQVKDI